MKLKIWSLSSTILYLKFTIFTENMFNQVDITGSLWHQVDIKWIVKECFPEGGLALSSQDKTIFIIVQ